MDSSVALLQALPSPRTRRHATRPIEPPIELRRPHGPRDPGDAWVEGDRGRFWGRFGSAGLLVHDAGKGVLLQHRALWSDQGGTWGLPGGALHQGEEAVHGALREAKEEAAIPPENVRVLFTSVFDVGYWTYTTVVVEVVAVRTGNQRSGKPGTSVGAGGSWSARRSCTPGLERPGRTCAAGFPGFDTGTGQDAGPRGS